MLTVLLCSLLLQYDKDGNGVIDFDEFLEMAKVLVGSRQNFRESLVWKYGSGVKRGAVQLGMSVRVWEGEQASILPVPGSSASEVSAAAAIASLAGSCGLLVRHATACLEAVPSGVSHTRALPQEPTTASCAACATRASVLVLKLVICPLAAVGVLKLLTHVEAPYADKVPAAPLASFIEIGLKLAGKAAE
jgi:hypothetical protein